MANPVIARSAASFRTELEMGQHRIIADEPTSAGGADEGPTPYDLLAGALASCKTMTLHFYAKREKLPLDGAEVSVSHDRQYAKDCAECLTKDGYVHRFKVEIRLIGPNLTEQQRQKLLEVSKRCPVAKTLGAEIRIDDALVD